ncbi:uncharacterized protein LOC118491548 [Helianthus annuus]|uniref:uncharacterized protein LOC118491548 n=1 Tax=Helianthus annuus TaxID=4232 RepID=UPI00165321BE|nr:uncharacterized protein LOC118491548 [Helianthus annuus]
MDSEFYNVFATTPAAPVTVIETIEIENETGTSQKPPNLIYIEDFKGWQNRFENWVQAYKFDAWCSLDVDYVKPKDERGIEKALSDYSTVEKLKYTSEKMMISLLQQAKIEEYELDIQKTVIMNNPNAQQDVSLYYRGSKFETTPSPKIKTAFSADSSSGTNGSTVTQSCGYSSSYSSFDLNFTTPSPQRQNSTNLQCNVTLNIQNGQNLSPEVAKQHMASLVTMIESYESLVAGRIGNPMLTKEDYDQIDAEELEFLTTLTKSGTGESDTTGPMPIVSDDRVSSEHEVHTSDVTSMDEDDFQPFALPEDAVELADGPFAGDLPLVEIPAPIPLAAYPALDVLLDADADDDVDLFDDEPLEDDVEGEALLAADPDRASSAAPAPSFAFEHDLDEDSHPLFPPGFDPDQDIEFIPLDQPMEDSVDPVDLADPAFADHADVEMAFDDPEPAMAPEPVAAPDLVIEHHPIHAGIPIVDPVIADLPIDDHPVDAPLLEGDHVVAAAQADAPLIADVPVDPIVAPLPDPVPLEPDHALFATHIDPCYAHTQNGWIDADDELPPIPPHTTDARHMDFPSSFAQFTPPARPGEGSSAHPFGHVPASIPVVPQFSTAIPPVPPFSVPPFDPASEPFLWTSPPIMPPSDPYHPFHMGYSIEDVLMSFVVQQEALTRQKIEMLKEKRTVRL